MAHNVCIIEYTKLEDFFQPCIVVVNLNELSYLIQYL